MRINTNIPALQALFQYNRTNDKLAKSLERLSSGKRINRAADDAAGLAISDKIDTQIRGLKQANRNALDGVSLIQTAEGALNEVGNMLQRMRELGVQASNGTLSTSDRRAIQDEIDQLSLELERVSTDIEFNGMTLLDGSLDRLSFSNKPKVASVFSLTDAVEPGEYTFNIAAEARATTLDGADATTDLYTAAVPSVVDPTRAGDIYLNGFKVEIKDTDTRDDVLDKLNKAGAAQGFSVSRSAGLSGRDKLTITNDKKGNLPLSITGNPATLEGLGLNVAPVAGSDVTLGPMPAGSKLDASSISIHPKGDTIEFRGDDGFRLIVQNSGGTGDVKIDVLSAGPLDLQIGANEGQRMEVRIPNTSPQALDIENISVLSPDAAKAALGRIDKALNEVISVRSNLGAYQNRLEYTQSNLLTATENMTASLSRILDTDMAQEMAQYTQYNVISQAGMAMISQANQIPEQVLQLLRG